MSTRVYVQNHTSLDFPIGRTSLRNPPRHPLPPSSFEWYTARIPAMTRRKLLEFERAANVRNGESYEFHSPLKLQDATIDLRQRMRGTPLHSKLWCSAGGDPWFDDEQWHTIIWRTPRGPVEIVYRSYGTGGDNDIEYIINPAFAPNPVQDTFNVLAYNVYMRPEGLFKNGQKARARLIPERIRDYDVLVLSEVFDDSVRALLLQGLRADYPHHTLVAGSDGPFKQDGGVMILSRWPIQARDRLEFRVQNLRRFDPDTMCHGDDCLAEKGVVYARIGKEERTYHVFGTHLQADSGGVEAAVRVRQLLVIQSWIDAKAIPPTDMVIIAGDLNIDRGTNEHGSMLQILRATNPPTGGHPYTVDPEINELSGSDRRAFLDYVLFSRRHLQPSSASLEVRPIRAPRGWGIDDDEWDLSDHFPVYGRFRFGRPAFTVSPPLLRFERVPADTTVVHDEGLTVTSVGSGPVTIRAVQLRGGAAAALFQVTASPPAPFPVTLPPGQRFPVAVAFRGQAEGRHQAEVTVTGDDLLGAPVTATAVLVAEVVVPDMSVLPTSINFGPVRVGQEVVRNVLVTNNGSAPLRYRVEPPSQPRFQWPAETAVGRSLPPGDAAVVAVRYVPDAPGAHSAVLTVVGDDETVLRVALSGQGVPP